MMISLSRIALPWPLLIFIGLTGLLSALFIYGLVYHLGEAGWSSKINQSFYLPIEGKIGVATISPLMATVYVRPRAIGLERPNQMSDVITSSDDYAERLVVISPQNWMIYTNNGFHFHFISNNITPSATQCDTTTSLSAIEYRLLAAHESLAEPNQLEKLRFSCVHYNYDQLVRIFAHTADKASYDLADYFDKKKNSQAPELTVDEILELLIINAIL